MTDATRHGGDRRDVAATTTGEIGPDRELVRLRAENLALQAELIGLRLAASRGTARRAGDTGSGLRDLAAALRAAALRSERLAEQLRERDGRLAGMAPPGKKEPPPFARPLPPPAEPQGGPGGGPALGPRR